LTGRIELQDALEPEQSNWAWIAQIVHASLSTGSIGQNNNLALILLGRAIHAAILRFGGSCLIVQDNI